MLIVTYVCSLECEKKMKRKMKQMLTFVMIFSIFVSTNMHVNAIKEANPSSRIKEYEAQLIEECSDILVGEVVSLESKWVNSSKQNRIVSYAEIKVEKVGKGPISKSATVPFVFDGGTVNQITLIAHTNPFGELSCKTGDTIKLFAATKDEVVRAARIDVLKSSTLENNPMRLTVSTEMVYEEQGCNFEYLNKHWSSGDFPVTYRVNENCGDLTGEDDEVEDAFQTWENHAYSDIDFTNGGSCTTTSYSRDNNNDVFWGTSLSNGIVATCWLWVSGSSILEFDIEFNGDDYTWCNGYVNNEHDVQNTATHEIGHALNLRDLYDSSNSALTMYYFIDDQEISKRSLNTGDMWGAQHIYPETSAASITVNQPSSTVNPSTQVTVEASISSSYTISQVKFKAADADDFDYDTGWVSMSKVGSVYRGTWTTPSTLGDYYVTIRVYDNQGIYTFKAKVVEVDNI